MSSNNSLKFLAFLLAFLCFSGITSAQKILVLEKNNSPKRLRIKEGVPFTFKLKGSDSLNIETIALLEDTAVVFGNRRVLLSEISAVNIHKQRFGIELFSKLFLIAGPFYTGIVLVNGLLTKQSPVIHKSAVIGLPAALTVSYGIKFSEKRWFRLNKNKTIKVIDLTP